MSLLFLCPVNFVVARRWRYTGLLQESEDKLTRYATKSFLCSLPFKKIMANTYHQIYLQTIFAVKYRNAVIDRT